MNPQKTILEKLRQAQKLIDEAFEAARQIEFAEPEQNENPESKPLVAFRKSNPLEYENEFNGLIARIRNQYTMANGDPIHMDWFEFVRDLQADGKSPAEAHPEIKRRVQANLVPRVKKKGNG